MLLRATLCHLRPKKRRCLLQRSSDKARCSIKYRLKHLNYVKSIKYRLTYLNCVTSTEIRRQSVGKVVAMSSLYEEQRALLPALIQTLLRQSHVTITFEHYFYDP